MGSREIAADDGLVARQKKLPYPIVHYPGFYGSFFAFREAESPEAPLTFCLCAKEAIENYIELQLQRSRRSNTDPNKNFILDSRDFPIAIPESLRSAGVAQDRSIIDQLQFAERLCHDCNDVVPSYRYCHDMYGTKFMQNYGWYVNKKHFEYGLAKKASQVPDFPIREILFSVCPEEVREVVDDDLSTQIDRCCELLARNEEDYSTMENDRAQQELNGLWEALEEQNKQLGDLVENEVRQSFGYYKKGNRWTSETLLYQLIKSEFPMYEIQRHHRPDWLNGLELDIYLEEPAVGIEYQGIQHYEPVDHWGGQEALEQRQQRDMKKQRFCEKQGVNLVEFRYDEDLSESVVIEKLTPVFSA